MVWWKITLQATPMLVLCPLWICYNINMLALITIINGKKDHEISPTITQGQHPRYQEKAASWGVAVLPGWIIQPGALSAWRSWFLRLKFRGKVKSFRERWIRVGRVRRWLRGRIICFWGEAVKLSHSQHAVSRKERDQDDLSHQSQKVRGRGLVLGTARQPILRRSWWWW